MHSPTPNMTEPALGRLFAPRGIAVIGASADAAKLSGRPMEYLRRFGFEGRVVGVNPKYEEIAGFACVPRVEDLPDGIDLALILVQAPGVADALEACARKGIGFAISIAAGFAEAGDHAGQERLSEICRRYDIRLVGPNCVGLVVPGNGLAATFSTEVGRTMPRPGGIALVTQSGALGNALVQNFNAYGIGLRAWVSTGNEADLHCLDLIEHLIDDPETTAIGLFVEGLREGPRLLPLLRRARRAGKPVVALRAGRSEAGRGASASHTGKLAGRAAVWDGIVRQGGMIDARSLEHMVDIFRAIEAFGAAARAPEPSLGVLTVSGGLGVIVSDHAEEQGLRLARFGPGTREGLRGLLPPQMSVANPVDTALFTDAGGFGTCARLVLDDGDVDTLVVVISSMSHDYGQIVPWLCELGRDARATGRRVGVTYLAASDQFALDDQRALLAAGVLALPSAERLLAALGALRGGDGGAADPAPAASADPKQALAFPKSVLCRTVAEAVRTARGIGYPVALKIVSPDIAHKTEVGGVVVGIAGDADLERAWAAMTRSVAERAPDARIDGLEIQEMVTGGVETIVGCLHDVEFGPVAMVGWGGIETETINDVAFVALPATEHEVDEAIGTLRVAGLLAGTRGRPAADRAALVETVTRLANAFVSSGLAELDVNPLVARPHGVVALDYLAVAPAAAANP